jgi:hypothetical protein
MRCLVTAGKHVNNNRATARKLLGKGVPTETVSMQQRGKHTSITIEELLGNGVCCWGRPETIKRGSQPAEIRLKESLEMATESWLSFETLAGQDMSLGTEELK